MRSSTPSPEHAEAVSRRLATLGAELTSVGGDHTQWRGGEGPAAPAPDEAPPPVVVSRPGRHASRRRGSDLLSRLPVTTAHLAVLAVVVAVAVAASAWWVLAARARPAPLPPPGAGAAGVEPLVVPAATDADEAGHGESSADGGADGGAGPDSGADVTVDVAGKVRDPGIAVLPAGSRVVDAIEAAGGVRPHVDLTSLNLARLLVDGEQVVVGLAPPTPVGAAAAGAPGAPAPGALVNLNTADAAALDTLPGVGPVTAEAILSWRAEHGGFTAVEELLEVDGIGDATLADIAPHVTI